MWPERSITCTSNPNLSSITTSVVIMCYFGDGTVDGEPNCRIMALQISHVRATLIMQVHWSTVLQSPEEQIQIDQLALRLVTTRHRLIQNAAVFSFLASWVLSKLSKCFISRWAHKWCMNQLLYNVFNASLTAWNEKCSWRVSDEKRFEFLSDTFLVDGLDHCRSLIL